MITYQYEEYKQVRRIWTWLAIILLAVITLSWAMVTHMVLPDAARHWDFDVLADTPASSPYATVPPPQEKTAPAQIELPPDYAGQEVNVP